MLYSSTACGATLALSHVMLVIARRPHSKEKRAWSHLSTLPFYSSLCQKRLRLRPRQDSARCYKINIIGHQQLPGLGASLGALLIGAIPKAGSTQLRDRLVQWLAPAYKNFEGFAKGEENQYIPCDKIKAKIKNMTYPRNSTFSGSFVREPLSRFISGIAEVVKAHCKDWLQWRLRNSVDGNQGLLAVPSFGQQTACKVLDSAGNQLAWHEPSTAWPLLKAKLIADVAKGYRNVHTDPQAWLASDFPTALDAILQVENATHWDLFLAAAGVSPKRSRKELSNSVRHSSDVALSRAMAQQSERTFCKLFIVDYMCLGYPVPPKCKQS